MSVTFDDQPRRHLTVMRVEGPLLRSDASAVQDAVSERIGRRIRDIVIDMSQADFVDSAGLEALLWIQEACEEHLGQVRLIGCDDTVQTILQVTRLSARLDISDSEEDAIRSMGVAA